MARLAQDLQNRGIKLSDHFPNHLLIKGPIQTIAGTLPYPMLSGRWEDWDRAQKKTKGYCMMHIIVHGGAKEDDFEFSWVDKKTIKIRLKWSVFMQNALLMTSLLDTAEVTTTATTTTTTTTTTTNTANPQEQGHPVHTELEKNAKNQEESDSNIMSEGLFRFNRPMDTSEENYKPEVFQFPVNKDGNTETIFRILFHEKS